MVACDPQLLLLVMRRTALEGRGGVKHSPGAAPAPMARRRLTRAVLATAFKKDALEKLSDAAGLFCACENVGDLWTVTDDGGGETKHSHPSPGKLPTPCGHYTPRLAQTPR